jgi:hypothetical protein
MHFWYGVRGTIMKSVYTSDLGTGVVSSSGSCGMVEKSTFSGAVLGAVWKTSGGVWGIFRKIPEENGAKCPIFLEF